MAKKRYAQVGLGSRGEMYWRALSKDYRDTSELVGISDINRGRLEMARRAIEGAGIDVRAYSSDEFDTMLAETRPDTVIVTSKDSTHDLYIVKALDAGCDVVTEKPLTIDEQKLQRILDAIERSDRRVRVTFNYRYSPVREQVKELLLSGIVGDVLSLDFNWNLNTDHGADYYRRWHRNKCNSGGLMVHKATHHFDLVNWWLSSVPVTVAALGARQFYTTRMAREYGLEGHSERCRDCTLAAKCNFHLDMAGNEGLRTLYLDHEKHDGYFRDRCVFSPEIDIEDTMCLVVRYKSGAVMSYSLNSFLPWEGYRIAFNGTRGRLEHVAQETVYISGDGTTPGEMKKGDTTITMHPHFRKAYEIPVHEARGGHGGGDSRLLDDLFGATLGPDPLGSRADHWSGAYSILTGISANRSMRTGQVVEVASLVEGLKEPHYPKWNPPKV
jgi:predicted dehydrogenase